MFKVTFFRLVRNPAYCGLIPIRLNTHEQYLVKGIHDPLISEALFYEVHRIITAKRKVTATRDHLKTTFYLRGFLVCPICDRKLCGSFPQGSTKRYPYYHCQSKCKTRINALILNECYQRKLQQLVLSGKAVELFKCILEDWNANTQKMEYIKSRNLLERKLNDEESILSKARKLFVSDILKFDDYNKLKREYLVNSKCLKSELRDINTKLMTIDKQSQFRERSFVDILRKFTSWDVADQKQLVNLILPDKVDFQTGDITLRLHSGLSKILLPKR